MKLNQLTKKKNLYHFCRKLVGSFKHAEDFQRRLKEKQSDLNYESRIKLIQDILIRWNSKYDMIESILSNKDLLSMSYEQVNNKIRHNIPDGAEWDILNEFCDLLAPLKELTTVVKRETICNSFNFVSSNF